MSDALRLAAWLNGGAWHAMRLGDVEAAGRELRRLAGVEAELQQAREERTAWRVTAENAEAAVKQARIDALEEAKQACEKYKVPTQILGAHPDYLEGKLMQKEQCAAAIESLKGTP